MDFDLFCDESPASFIQEPITRLREYQDQAAANVIGSLREHRGVVAVMATGTGKTVVFAHLTKHYTGITDENTGRKGRVLVLAHADELIEQARDKLAKVLGMPVSKEKAQDRASLHDQVVVASVQTLRGARLRTWPPNHFTLIVVDEAHHVMAATYQEILAHFSSAKVLGVTATLTRGDKKQLRNVFSHVAFDYGLRRAVADGWLVRPLGMVMPFKPDFGKLDTRAGDFMAEQVAHRLTPYLDEIARVSHAEIAHLNPTMMAFLPNVATAQLMAESLMRAGFRAAAVWGSDPDRTKKIEALRRGELNAICNPMVLTEGFDLDRVDTVLPLRLTKLWGLYSQMCGRSTRPLAEIVPALNAATRAAERREIIARSAKPYARVLDFLGLYEGHATDMMRPANLVAPSEEVARQMRNDGDLMENEEAGERSLFEALEKALDEASRKKRKAQTLDPFKAILAAGDNEEAEEQLNYEPMNKREAMEATPEQLRTLTKFGIDVSKIKDRGHASRVISWIFARLDKGLCDPRTLVFLKRQGIDASAMPAAEARRLKDDYLKRFRERRAGQRTLSL